MKWKMIIAPILWYHHTNMIGICLNYEETQTACYVISSVLYLGMLY